MRPEDAGAHEHLLCVSSGSTMSDPNRFKFHGDSYYIKSPEEMRELWADRNGLPEACDNTLLIAERCNVEFNTSANYMPRFPVPEGESEDSWFVKEVEKGLAFRYPQGIPDKVRKQAEFETGVITQMGFPGYFLVVADFINWAKDNGIRVGPGRGSGAGSIAAYAMRITDLDPLEHGLIFERFLNPDRVSMPDFDIDFDDRRRGEVIDYVSKKYGDDRVSMIVTYGTIKAKQAVKDSSRILGYPFAMGDRVTKAMPASVMGKDVPLKEIFDPNHPRYGEGGEFRALYDSEPDVKTVVDTAIGLEGLKRQWGVHAAGVIMSSEPLLDVIPIMRRPQDGAVITQFDYPTCERLGLIKMDFLGLRNLTVLDDALRNIESQPRREGRARGARADRPEHLRAAPARRHPRRLPARRRPDAGAAAQHAARHLRGHLRGRRALPSRPDGRGLPQQVRPPQDRSRAGRGDPPRAGRGPRGRPGRDLRSDRLPGAGHGDRAEAGRLHAGPGRPAASRHGQEEEVRAGQAVRDVLRRHGRARATPWPRSTRCGTSCCRSPTTPSTRPTPRRTAWSPTGRPTSRPTTRRSTWRPC